MPLSPQAKAGRLGALVLHGSGRTSTAAGTAGFLNTFLTEARAEAAARGETPSEAELEKRANYKLRAQMTRVRMARSRKDARAAARAARKDTVAA
jgi:hypothetical protein